LVTNGSISLSPSISIAAGAVLDVASFTGGTFALAGGQSLTASGYGTVTNIGSANAAVLHGPASGSVSLGSQPITLKFIPTGFTGDSAHPSLYVSQGTLSLTGNAFTVNNAAGTPLGAGTYTLIQQASGTITSSGSYTVSVTGSGLAAGTAGSISVSGSAVNLVVQTSNNAPLPVVVPPAVSPTTGTFSITFSGTPGTTYTIQYSPNCTGGPWTTLTNITPGANGLIALTNTPSPSAPQRFYRIYPEQ
jgi:hypothetical protein